MTERPEVVCLCGSLRFAVEMIAASDQLALEGSIVLTPAFLTAVDNGDRPALSAEEREALGELHLRRIDLADRVLVVNPGGYLGESTQREIAHARAAGKAVSFTDHEERRQVAVAAASDAPSDDQDFIEAVSAPWDED